LSAWNLCSWQVAPCSWASGPLIFSYFSLYCLCCFFVAFHGMYKRLQLKGISFLATVPPYFSSVHCSIVIIVIVHCSIVPIVPLSLSIVQTPDWYLARFKKKVDLQRGHTHTPSVCKYNDFWFASTFTGNSQHCNQCQSFAGGTMVAAHHA